MSLEPNANQQLKCLSIQQPWAWMVCSGDKDIENRVWKTDYRGTIAIHASTKESQVNSFLKRANLKKSKSDDFQFGAIIGLADIESISLYGKEHEANPHASGPYCWKMTNGRFLRKPIPMLGQLGLRSLPDEIATKVLESETIQAPLDSPVRSMLRNNMEPPPKPVENYENCIELFCEKQVFEELEGLVTRMVELDSRNPYSHLYRINLAVRSDEVRLPDGYCEAFESAVVATYGNGSDDLEFRRVYEEFLESECDPGVYRKENQLAYDPDLFYRNLAIYLRSLYEEFLESGNTRKAMEYSDRLIAFEADAPENLVDRGVIFLKGLSDPTSAIAVLRKAIYLCDHGHESDAKPRMARYLDDDPNLERESLARGLLLLSQALCEADECGDAMIVCERLVKISPADPDAFVEACRAAIQNDDQKTAKKHLKKALELDAEHEEALSLHEYLYDA